VATVSRYVVFMRAFLLTLILGVPGGQVRGQGTDSADWERSSQSGTAEAYFWYLRRNPAGAHVGEAVTALRSLGAIGGGGAAARSVRGIGDSDNGRDGGGSVGGGDDPY
jgi:hypothetical protein